MSIFRAIRMPLLALMLLGLAPWGAPVPARAADMPGKALVEALQGGGHTIYFRHSSTDWSQNDQVRQAGDWKTCDGARMRQLSDAGRDLARAIGRAMKALKVPVGRVISSEYCRSAETAKLFGFGDPETTTDIMNLRSDEYVGGHDAAVANARRIFATPPPDGTNTVVVGHGNLMRAAIGEYTGEAGAVVLRPKADSPTGFETVTVLDPKDWQALATAHAPMD